MVTCLVSQASAVEVEKLATQPIESLCSQVSGVKSIQSVSESGKSIVTIEVSDGRSKKTIYLAIQKIIRQAFPQFDNRVRYPQVLEFSSQENDVAAFSIVFKSYSGDLARSSSLEEYIIRPLQQLEAVRNLEIIGDTHPTISVLPNAKLLNNLGVNESQISNAIEKHLKGAENQNSGGRDFAISDIRQELEDIRIFTDSIDQTITISDLADLSPTLSPSYPKQRIDGMPTIRLNIYLNGNTNPSKFLSKLTAIAGSYGKLNHPQLEIASIENHTENLVQNLNSLVKRSLISLGLLILFLIVFYRKLRVIIVVVISLMVAFSWVIPAFTVLELNLDNYALAGLALSLGIMLDNMIVVIGNLEEGKNMLSSSRIVLGASITTIVVLFLLSPLNDSIRFEGFAESIAVTVGTSVIISIFFVPALYFICYPSGFLPENPTNLKNLQAPKLSTLLSVKWVRVVSFITLGLLIGIPWFMLPREIDGNRLYNATLGSSFFLDNIRPRLEKYTGGVLSGFHYNTFLNSRNNRIPPSKNTLTVSGSPPNGLGPEFIDPLVSALEEFILLNHDVKSIQTSVLESGAATLIIELKKNALPAKKSQLTEALISQCLLWSGYSWKVEGDEHTPSWNNTIPNPAPGYRIALRGYNHALLQSYSEAFIQMLSENPRVKDIEVHSSKYSTSDNKHFVLALDPWQLAVANVSERSLIEKLKEGSPNRHRQQFSGVRNGTLFNVNLILQGQRRYDIATLKNMGISGAIPPLNSIGKIIEVKGSPDIWKEDRDYLSFVEYTYFGNEDFGNKFLAEKIEVLRLGLAPGFEVEKEELWAPPSRENPNFWALPISLLFIFWFCSILFENFRFALYILLILPISYFGNMLAFQWVPYSFDMGGYASFLFVTGISINAGIYLVGDFLENKRKGLNHNQSLVQAYRSKYRPILLTSISTILGLIPFLMLQKTYFWYSLAVGSIGGISFSLLGVFFFLPLVFFKTN